MDLADFDYELPRELIAQHPPLERDRARMLVVYKSEGRWEDRMFRDFPGYLQTGDCVVFNESRVLPSRLFGHKEGQRSRVEVFLLRALNQEGSAWTALVRPGRKAAVGETIHFEGGVRAEVIACGERGERTIRFADAGRIYEWIEEAGQVPLPPYIQRNGGKSDDSQDRERYQTVFAKERGSVAAPTAGLHFTPATLEKIRGQGVDAARLTLHVGLGTFQPISTVRIEDHRMHSERYSVAAEEWSRIQGSRRAVGVGTTSVRTMESIARSGLLSGETEIYIYPGFEFQRTGAILTNFHMPRTSLLLLVSAFASRELILAAYRHAVAEKYRFFSYGDCMLIV